MPEKEKEKEKEKGKANEREKEKANEKETPFFWLFIYSFVITFRSDPSSLLDQIYYRLI